MSTNKSPKINKTPAQSNKVLSEFYLINIRRMADDDEIKEYRWETGYEKTWEEIREDKEGELDQALISRFRYFV